MDGNTLDILGFFVRHFRVDVIYDLGWDAAKSWMIYVSGIVTVIAIMIRSVENKVSFITSGKSNIVATVTTVGLIAVAMGSYFMLAGLIIDFFNAIYSLTGTNESMAKLTQEMDALLTTVFNKEFDLSWGDVINSVYVAFAFICYAITYCVLVFVIFAMRMAHAVLFSFCVFWGAVALPMSITVGLKQLQALRTIFTLALIWPIIDAFFLYLVGGTFAVTMQESGMTMDNFSSQDTITLSQLLFFLGVFCIMNLFLIATTVAAPFVAQGMANGSGNVTGLIGSFAAAGISAGAIAGKSMSNEFNRMGSLAGNDLKGRAGLAAQGLKNEFADEGAAIKGLFTGDDGSTNFGQSQMTPNENSPSSLNSGGGLNPNSSTSSSNNTETSSVTEKNTSSDSSGKASSENNTSAENKLSESTGIPASKLTQANMNELQGSLSDDQMVSNMQGSDQNNMSSENQEESGLASEEIEKKKQARRAAIINQQGGKK